MSKQTAVTSIIPEFRGASDDWNVYREILEEFYRAHGIMGAARVPVLISVIGKETYRTLRGLCHPRSPKEMDYCARSLHVSLYRRSPSSVDDPSSTGPSSVVEKV